MQKALLLTAVTSVILTAGCASRPVNVSRLRRSADLERYVGREVVFTGTASAAKAGPYVVSNGTVGKPLTIRGILRKMEYPSRPAINERGEPVQIVAPGPHYYLQ